LKFIPAIFGERAKNSIKIIFAVEHLKEIELLKKQTTIPVTVRIQVLARRRPVKNHSK